MDVKIRKLEAQVLVIVVACFFFALKKKHWDVSWFPKEHMVKSIHISDKWKVFWPPFSATPALIAPNIELHLLHSLQCSTYFAHIVLMLLLLFIWPVNSYLFLKTFNAFHIFSVRMSPHSCCNCIQLFHHIYNTCKYLSPTTICQIFTQSTWHRFWHTGNSSVKIW